MPRWKGNLSEINILSRYLKNILIWGVYEQLSLLFEKNSLIMYNFEERDL